MSGRGLVLILALLAPRQASAQEPLDAVITLSAAGRSEEARSVLIRWWEKAWSAASRLDKQRGLWMRARLTVDPALAELDYQRLVVEYPGGPYSGGALYRLAQFAEARSDAPGAASHYQALTEGYPGSGHAAVAARWLGQHPDAVAELHAAEAAPGRATPPPREMAVGEDPEPKPVAEPSGGYALQLGAFSEADRARRLADRVASEGLNVRLVRVPGSELVRVRIGRFEDQDGALELMRAVRALGFDVALVTDAAQEDPVS